MLGVASSAYPRSPMKDSSVAVSQVHVCRHILFDNEAMVRKCPAKRGTATEALDILQRALMSLRVGSIDCCIQSTQRS